MARSQWSHLYNDRRWREFRAAHMRANPLCERCLERGILEPASVCDHVEPHKGNLERFWAGPFQSLCKYHHDVKTIMEDGGLNSGGQTHPEWLPQPACPVVLVSGPPGAGKTTYCTQEARRSDEVIDLDVCFQDVCGVHGHEADRKYLGKALRLRNKLLANLAAKTRGRAFVIVSCPALSEAEWWIRKLAAAHTRLDPGIDICLERTDKRRHVAVRSWYAKAEANAWTPKSEQMGFDAEGNPIGELSHWR